MVRVVVDDDDLAGAADFLEAPADTGKSRESMLGGREWSTHELRCAPRGQCVANVVHAGNGEHDITERLAVIRNGETTAAPAILEIDGAQLCVPVLNAVPGDWCARFAREPARPRIVGADDCAAVIRQQRQECVERFLHAFERAVDVQVIRFECRDDGCGRL